MRLGLWAVYKERQRFRRMRVSINENGPSFAA